MSSENRASPALAIIGIGCLFPRAPSREGYWANLKNGVDAITEIPDTHWSVKDFFDADPKARDRTYGARGGFLDPVEFNPLEFGLTPNALEATDSTQLLGLLVARSALEDAGYGPVDSGGKAFDRDRVGVILGVTGTLELVIPLGARLGHPIWRRALAEAGVDPSVAEDVVRRISDSYVDWKEDSFPGLLGNVAAGRIANRLNLGGTNCVVDAACASSLSAIHMAGLELAAGRADMVVTGGMDTFNDIFMYMCFTKTPALSPTNDARPFDAGADGTILGEGLGAIVLKRLEDAERDGDRIYALIRGIGSSSDGKGTAIYEPSASGQAKALRAAYRDAGVSPDTVEMVEAHGTGTPVGDATEVRALNEVYREARAEGTWCALGSVKSEIGHTKAAAGAAGLIKAALALRQKVIPPTLKVKRPAPGLEPGRSPFYVNTEKRPWLPRAAHPRRAGVSSFGFGGSNFHVVLEEYRDAKSAPDWDGDVQIAAFSGATSEAILRALDAWPTRPEWVEARRLAAQSRSAFRVTDPCRLLLVLARDGTAWEKGVDSARRLVATAGEDTGDWTSPDGAAFGRGPAPGKLGFVFPGQGSQYVGMGLDLACQFPVMLEALAAADRAFGDANGRRLSDHIYPHPVFGDRAARAADEAALRDTRVAQPALGAVSTGALRVLESTFGVHPEAVAGHSYGELVALHAAGRLDAASLHSLSRLRGRLMGEADNGTGGMLAVRAPAEQVEAVLSESGLDLVLANRNAPTQVVLSGRKEEIGRAAEILTERGVTNRALNVSAAFHSPLVAEARPPFEEALEEIAFPPSPVPVFANATGDVYPEIADAAREVLGGQLVRPVQFVREIEAMHELGVRTFLEVGPGARMTGLVKTILEGREQVAACAVDSSNGKRSGILDLAQALARIAARGHAVDLCAWDEGYPPANEKPATDGKRMLTVSISGANYVKPRTDTARPPVAPARSAPSAEPPLPEPEPAAARPPSEPSAAPPPAPPPAALEEALRSSREFLLAIQRSGEQTAELHRKFLEGQEASQNTLRSLIEQQAALARAWLGDAPAPIAPPSPPDSRGVEPAPPETAPKPAGPGPSSPGAPPVSPSDGPTVGSTVGSTVGTDAVTRAVLEVISEKTGYPPEMLDLDMGLDADLGIDSIKRVEILSALEQRLPDAPAIRSEDMGALETLAQVVAFLARSAPPAPPAPGGSPATEVTSSRDSTDIEQALIAVVSEKTGYPPDMLDLEMGLDSDLGIDSIKRVEILSALEERLPGLPAIRSEEMGELTTLAQVVAFLASDVRAPSAAPPPAGVPAEPAPAEGTAARIERVLLEVVSEKTGYPPDMLDLEMGLDSDLGIDSIKRVEILSALEERLAGVRGIRSEELGELRTLRQVVDQLAGSVADETTPHPPKFEEPHPPKDVAAERIGVAIPSPALERSTLAAVELGRELERVRTRLAENAEIWVTHDASQLSAALGERLGGLGYRVKLIAVDDVQSHVPPPDLGGLVLLQPEKAADAAFMRNALLLVQRAGPALRRAGREVGALLATVSRLDGAFGLGDVEDGRPSADPRGGALAGLAKTVGHEWPEVTSRAIDLDPSLPINAAAQALVDEIFRSKPREVGLGADGRRTLALAPAALPAASTIDAIATSVGLEAGDVMVISGGARGVTAEVAVALARAIEPKLILLGRSPPPEPEPDWLRPLEDEATIKRALLDRGDGRLRPRDLETRYRALMANREMLKTLDRIGAAGGCAACRYHAVDVRDRGAVAAIADRIRAEHGPIRGLIHGAGVVADRLIQDKTPEQFDAVWGTKVGGLESLLAALEPDRDALRLLVLFSSSTGRFGRAGQVDYAMANEALNKIAQREARRRPACRVVSFNWGPWNGGMVTPALARVFEAEGIGLIEPEAGAAAVVRELAAGRPGPVEVLLMGAAAREPAEADPSDRSAGLPVAFERRVDLQTYPILRDHVIDGKPVVPMAILVEWLAHGAMHGNPGLSFVGFDNLRVLKGMVLEDDLPHRVRVRAGKAERRDDSGGVHMVPVEVLSDVRNDRDTLHAAADILLAPAVPAGSPAIEASLLEDAKPGPSPAVIYRDLLFHGPLLQGVESVDACSSAGIAVRARSAPWPEKWIDRPLRNRWLSDPLVLDVAFQAIILWCLEHRDQAALPNRAGRYRQFVKAFPGEAVRVVGRVTRTGAHAVNAEIELLAGDGRLLARIDDFECTLSPSLKAAFRRNRLEIRGEALPS